MPEKMFPNKHINYKNIKKVYFFLLIWTIKYFVQGRFNEINNKNDKIDLRKLQLMTSSSY